MGFPAKESTTSPAAYTMTKKRGLLVHANKTAKQRERNACLFEAGQAALRDSGPSGCEGDYFTTDRDMFSVNKKGRNYQKGVPLSSDFRNQVVELAQHYSFSEVGRRLHVSKGAVSNIVKRYNLTGSTAPKKFNHVGTVPKCTFQGSSLLETMVQASSFSSLKELRNDLAIHGDCGELSSSTLSRDITNKLPSGPNYSRKRLGKCASERFTPENIVYTQLYIDYLKDKDPFSVKFFDESGFQLPDAGHRNLDA